MPNGDAFSRSTHFTDKWPYIADNQLIDGQSVIDQSIDRWSNIQTIDGQAVIKLILERSDIQTIDGQSVID